MTFSYLLKVQTFVTMPMKKLYLHLVKIEDYLILDKWFFNKFLAMNPDKCNFMTLGTPIHYPILNAKVS